MDKFTTPFNATLHTVVSKAGNKITFESPTGGQYSHNTTFVKKYVEKEKGNKQSSKTLGEADCSTDSDQHIMSEDSQKPVICQTPKTKEIASKIG